MAVTGAIFNSLTFGGVNSADYGIYITGEAVFNAPKRAVEMVSVPGRNGDVAIDQGRWENIEVTYSAGTFGMNESEFRTALSDFRNAILSQIGYQKLTDTYHPDEYRMALYAEGLEVKASMHNRAGEFDLKFNCKPQRWLTSGETAETVSSGDTLTNPTRYDASPLLAVNGYGTINFNGFDVEIASGDYGDVTIAEPAEFYTNNFSITIPAEYIKSGDTVTLSGLTIRCRIQFSDSSPYHFYGDGWTAPIPSDTNSDATSRLDHDRMPLYGTKQIALITAIPNITFTIGTSETWENVATVADLQVTEDYGTTLLVKTTLAITDTVAYDATTQTITITQGMTHSPDGDYASALTYDPFGYSRAPSRIESVVVNSTLTYLGAPTYIDCDLGEAYKIEDDTFISLNSYIDLGSDLPVFAPGANRITFDNTIESLEITPRWWKL